MANEILKHGLSVLEQIKHTNENGNKYWMAKVIFYISIFA